MISKKCYDELKLKYGNVSSWTIWSLPTTTPKSNTDDISIFNNNIINSLNNNYVFVGLNASSTHGDQGTDAWKNFHSDYRYQNDYKLRYALLNTKFWGCYITDIIKEYKEVDSSKVKKYLSTNQDVIKHNIEIFENEINILSNENIILIAIGDYTYEILSNSLKDKYRIYKIPHYSSRINKEEYREKVLNVLNKIN